MRGFFILLIHKETPWCVCVDFLGDQDSDLLCIYGYKYFLGHLISAY